MTFSKAVKTSALLVAVAMLFACGSSDPDAMPMPVDPTDGIEGGGIAGIEGGGIVSAVSIDLSKVTISNVVYDSTAMDLVVFVDDQTAAVADLRVGYTIKFTAVASSTGTEPTLKSVETLAELEGPITAGTIDPASQSFRVLGQLVEVIASTEFDDELQSSGFAQLNDGDLVEVSGFIVESGVIRASRIELNQTSDEFEVFGQIENLDTANFLFDIGGLTVNYASAELEDFAPGAELQNGDLVEVEGEMLDSNGIFIATEIEAQSSEFSGEDGAEGNVEGTITRFVSATDFDVAGYPVTTDSLTGFERGGIGDLATGVQVKVEGTVNGDGVLVARKVEFTADESESTSNGGWL